MTNRMVGSVLTLLTLLFSAGDAVAQTYTQIQWGMNKTVTPYQFGANINGSWYNLGTVTPAGVWAIPTANISGTWSTLQTFAAGIATPQLPNLTDNVQFTGIPGMTNIAEGWFLFATPTDPITNNPPAVFRVQRNDNYTGGSGVVKASWTACNTAVGQTDFVFCGLDTLNNISTGLSTNMVARYSQAFRQPGAGSTWASTFELRDYQANPTVGAVATEFDIFGYDGDTNSARAALDVVAGQIPGIVGHAPTVARLIRLGAQNGDAANATINRGISFYRATWNGALIGTEGSPAATNGIDLSGATFSGCATCLGGDQHLAFDMTAGAYTRYLRQATGLLVWHSPSGDVWNVSDAGNQTMSGWLKTTSTTIAALPACGAGLLGAEQRVSDGTDYATGTYGSAVSAAGAVTRKVLCTNTGGPTTYAWAYN